MHDHVCAGQRHRCASAHAMRCQACECSSWALALGSSPSSWPGQVGGPHLCMCACVSVSLRACVLVCLSACVSVCLCGCLSVCVCVCVWESERARPYATQARSESVMTARVVSTDVLGTIALRSGSVQRKVTIQEAWGNIVCSLARSYCSEGAGEKTGSREVLGGTLWPAEQVATVVLFCGCVAKALRARLLCQRNEGLVARGAQRTL